MSVFMFATGVENSYPTIAGPDGKPKRVDEMEKCDHYRRWREDFECVKALGIKHIRYGPAYYRVHLGPGHYDWSFTDEAFHTLRAMGIHVIADLCHFGVPDWLENFQNPDFPAFLRRVRARLCPALPVDKDVYPDQRDLHRRDVLGAIWLVERAFASDRTFVTALKHLCQANVLAMRAILDVQPNTTFHPEQIVGVLPCRKPECLHLAQVLNEKRFLSLDLTYGQPLNVTMYEYLRTTG